MDVWVVQNRKGAVQSVTPWRDHAIREAGAMEPTGFVVGPFDCDDEPAYERGMNTGLQVGFGNGLYYAREME